MFTANHFITKTIKDVTITARKSDRYVCANAFCAQFEKRIHDLVKINSWNLTIEAFKEAYPDVSPYYELTSEIPLSMKRRYSGTYCHIKLIPFITCWANPSKQFIVNELLTTLNDELDNPPSISEQAKQIKEITTDIKDIGRAGETLVFDRLKAYFPDLIDCHARSHASDFYSPYYNIRFEVKTKEFIDRKDYEKILTDDKMNQPSMTVVISNVLKTPPHIEVLPNILFIHVDELFQNMNTIWKPFIVSSKWERTYDVAERINAGIIRKETLQLSQVIKSLNKTTIIKESKDVETPIETKPECKFEDTSATKSVETKDIEKELKDTEHQRQLEEEREAEERNNLYEQISSIKVSLANAINTNDEKENSVKSYLHTNRKKFLEGGDSKHLMRDYGVHCRRFDFVGFTHEADLLNVILRLCLRYFPITTNKGNNDTYFIFKYTETAIKLVSYFKAFITERAYTASSDVRTVYKAYRAYERSIARPFLTEESFAYEFGLLLDLPDTFMTVMEARFITIRKRQATFKAKREEIEKAKLQDKDQDSDISSSK